MHVISHASVSQSYYSCVAFHVTKRTTLCSVGVTGFAGGPVLGVITKVRILFCMNLPVESDRVPVLKWLAFRLLILLVRRFSMQIFIVISVLGSGIVQIVASSSSQYAINKKYNKR